MKYVLEFEGFHLKSCFVFKEISVLCLDNGDKHFFFIKSPRIDLNRLSSKERNSIRYCERYLHRIHWKSGRDNFMKVKQFLLGLFSNSDVVFTKGLEKVKLLKNQVGIIAKVQDINDLLTYAKAADEWTLDAKRHQEDINDYLCPLKFHKNIIHCASIKAIVFKKYLNQTVPLKSNNQDE